MKRCSKFFRNQEAYKEHVLLHEKEEKKKARSKIRCNVSGCKTTFSSKNAFKSHVLKIHENVMLSCQFCRKEYKYSSCNINIFSCIKNFLEKLNINNFIFNLNNQSFLLVVYLIFICSKGRMGRDEYFFFLLIKSYLIISVFVK